MSSFQGFLKQNTATDVTILMIDSSDHITGKTGLAGGLTIYATKAAGTPATISPTVTELDATNVKGVYSLALVAGDIDTLGELQLHITAAGADPADYKWEVSTYLPGEAAILTSGERNSIADALLKRDWTSVTGEASRSVLNALRFVRNKFSTTINPGFVTIYKEDDTTPAYTKQVATDASAQPIVEG